jgi:hypothetical protein
MVFDMLSTKFDKWATLPPSSRLLEAARCIMDLDAEAFA